MTVVFKACWRAFRDICSPRMLLLSVWPMLAALALWLGLAWFYWAQWTQWVGGWLQTSILADWLPAGGVLELAHYAAWVLVALLLLPAVLATAGMLAAVLVMPLIVSFVARREYPSLEKRQGGGFTGSCLNAAVAISVFAALWLATLPLWMTAVLGAPLWLLLSGWLIQRLFRYDALAEHADAAEFRALCASSRGGFFMLGVLVALLYTLPLVNLFAPVIGGLAFTHFSLPRLAALRSDLSLKRET
jgi:uncharacterized protein involved in cysteine biosynthesis